MEITLPFIIKSIALGAGLAMDAFSVSLANGLNEPKMKKGRMSFIAWVFAFFQFLMPVLGYLLGSTFARLICAFDHWVAFGLLGFIGGKMIWEAVFEKEVCEESKNPLDNYTLFILAIATSIDALAVGITFATMTVPVLMASAIIGIITFFVCLFGVYLGSRCGNFLGNKAEVIGGLVLLGIGTKILIEHLFF